MHFVKVLQVCPQITGKFNFVDNFPFPSILYLITFSNLYNDHRTSLKSAGLRISSGHVHVYFRIQYKAKLSWAANNQGHVFHLFTLRYLANSCLSIFYEKQLAA